MLKNFIILIRPSHWVKNLFIFLPLFFGKQLTNIELVSNNFFTFVAFSLAASSIYCINDIIDRKVDRLHFIKRNRPIASGKISIVQGLLFAALLFCLSIITCILFIKNSRYEIIQIILTYFIINLFYGLLLKNLVIVDVVIIAIGFLIRIYVGGIVSYIELSAWIILMTFLLTLFLAIAKRRDDVLIFNQSGIMARKNIKNYNLEFLNQTLSILSAITIVCYIMYTVSENVTNRLNNNHLYLTSIFVIIGILRYLQLTVVENKSGDPTDILIKDRFTQINIILWITSYIYILYFNS